MALLNVVKQEYLSEDTNTAVVDLRVYLFGLPIFKSTFASQSWQCRSLFYAETDTDNTKGTLYKSTNLGFIPTESETNNN